MNRIRKLIKSNPERKLLIPFFTAGYPDLKSTLTLIRTAIAAGADMIEIGVPFSDPLADGPEIQHSSQHALAKGVSVLKIIELMERAREFTDVPMILMGYYNPIIAFNMQRFLSAAQKCGVDGLIIPDLPIEEAAALRKAMVHYDLSAIFLVAPTSPDTRINLIDRNCSDFVYAVTVAGVTGTGKKFDRTTDSYLLHLGRTLKKPFVAGFGISSVASAKQIAKHADGVVVGSALIRILRDARNYREGQLEVGRFLSGLRRGI